MQVWGQDAAGCPGLESWGRAAAARMLSEAYEVET